MKKLLTLITIALAVVVSSCSKFDDSAIWDKLNEHEQTLNDHEKRIVALEELCKQMNTNINALQTLVEALEKRDYITNVSPVREDGVVVGYTISFASSDTITIYNGKDGSDGTGGYTPQIGVKKDADGLYYWTLDGEWLLDDNGNKIKAVGEDGRDGQDGTDGTNGSNGSNGQDGQDGEDGTDGRDGVDGITPRLKIENDYWYVSYDEGATWIELGRATGEDGADGNDGSDGEDGDSIFSSVTQDEEYVYFNLADGTMITLPKHDKENIQFEDLQVKAICCKNWDTNNDGELSYAEAAAVTDIGTVFKDNSDIIAFTEFKYFTGLTAIPADAFNNCGQLWKITLPSTISSIDCGAFKHCSSINTISIPESVTTIDDTAFHYCSSIRYFYGKYSSSDNRCIIINGELLWFALGSGLESYTIPDGVTIINSSAFYSDMELTNISFPESLTEIQSHAFSGCKNISEVTIPDSVSTISVESFYDCDNLETVTIGEGIALIKKNAFFECDNLINIYCKATIAPAIYYNSYGTSGTFPAGGSYKIYVPRGAKAQYTGYDVYSTSSTEYLKGNWYLYKKYVYEYDF